MAPPLSTLLRLGAPLMKWGALSRALPPTTPFAPCRAYRAPPLRYPASPPACPVSGQDQERNPGVGWQTPAEFRRKLFGRHGAQRSGVDPGELWLGVGGPSSGVGVSAGQEEELSLMDRLQNIAKRQAEDEERQRERESRISAAMSSMPARVAAWRSASLSARQAAALERGRRSRLVERAREKLGMAVDPRSQKFQTLLAEMEDEERRRLKKIKRQQKALAMAAKKRGPGGEGDAGGLDEGVKVGGEGS